ncbi:MAG: carotenoid 1,2-hydratase [Gammaproteobacteria bacterium]|nr:carotenoid 1,2-hydratase [Gammaproteobacteria bacterium]
MSAARLATVLALAWIGGCGDIAPDDRRSPDPDAAQTSDGRAGVDPQRDGEPDTGAPTGIRYLSGGGDSDGFARATVPRAFEFPADHGGHPEYRSEWWYFTGNVFGSDRRHYGFELTFFRYALADEPPPGPSAWSTNQFWMAHLAVTDTRNGRLLAEERLTRGALGLAGAEASPFRVWVEDWSVSGRLGRTDGSIVLEARGERIALDLALAPSKGVTPNGDRGLDGKGPEPGNASFYYSMPRIDVRGRITVDGREDAVSGLAWMDREWSTSALTPDLEGWDWFALQLSDGRDLMVYRLRRRDGTASPYSGGSLIDADGARRRLDVEDFVLEPLDHWYSERTGTRYPVAWRLRLPDEDLQLEVRPYVDDQELDLSVRYWEGAVSVEGRSGSGPVTGNGYLELAGY